MCLHFSLAGHCFGASPIPERLGLPGAAESQAGPRLDEHGEAREDVIGSKGDVQLLEFKRFVDSYLQFCLWMWH